MRKLSLFVAILLLSACFNVVVAMTLEQVDTACLDGTDVYYAPESHYRYFAWLSMILPGAPFDKNTEVKSAKILRVRSDRLPVDGQITVKHTAFLDDGKSMSIGRLFVSVDGVKSTYDSAFATKLSQIDSIKALIEVYRDSVLDIGTSVLGVSEETLNFGESTTELTLEIFNTGNARLNWVSTNPLPDNITIAPDEGKILPGADAVIVTVTVNRTDVSQGEYTPIMNIIGDNETIIIELIVIVP